MTATAVAKLLRPLSARSLIASTLLGSQPPELPGRLLVALGERFGIAGGTMRVALSRMVDRGELINTAGRYGLTGALLERKERQDLSRDIGDPRLWDGTWEQAVVVASGRSAGDRDQLRRGLAALGLGERREGVWMRPANLDPGRLQATREMLDRQVEWFLVEPLEDGSAATLAAELFALDEWAATAEALRAAMSAVAAGLGSDDAALVEGFIVSAAVLRHFLHDPQLPDDVQPPQWPGTALRDAYDAYDTAYRGLLGGFFAAAPIGPTDQ